jgi:hypothetical protein
MGRKN